MERGHTEWDLPKRPQWAHGGTVSVDNTLIARMGDASCVNDTRCFQYLFNQWSESNCLGDIPAPRHRHAATVIDDIMYIYGINVQGHTLNDLLLSKSRVDVGFNL